jgi:predicted tellurium resistance membrane protein TerC
LAGLVDDALDVDNALYMTSAIEELPADEQKRAIRWGLLIEFGPSGAGSDLWLPGQWNGGGFELFGIEFTAETVSLLGAGLFLLIRSLRELFRFIIGDGEPEAEPDQVQGRSFDSILIEMSLVNALLSVDTVIAITGSAVSGGGELAAVIYLLLFSGVVRLIFVREIARFIKRYPATNIFILTFLIIIGIELTTQGLGVVVPERMFNGLMLLALLVTVVYQWRFTRPEKPEQ